MKNEIWKPVKGYEGRYEVSNFGRVKSLDRWVKSGYGSKRKVCERILKPGKDKDGYLLYALMNSGKRKTHRGHQIVAKAFIKNPDKHPLINHKDCNKANNNINNLEWCSHKHNVRHALANGCCKRMVSDKIAIEIYGMYKQGIEIKEISKKFSLHNSTVSRIANGKRHKHLQLENISRQPKKQHNEQ